MTSFEFEPKTLLVNSAADFPLNFFIAVAANGGRLNLLETDDAFTASTKVLVAEGATYSPDADGATADTDGGGAGTAVAITDVDALAVVGYKTFYKGQINRVRKTRGILGQKQKSTLTFAVNTPDVGSQVKVVVTITSWLDQAEFSGYASEFQRSYPAILDVKQGETAATLAAQLTKAFSTGGNREERAFPLIVTGAANVVSFESKDPTTAFSISITGVTDTLTGNAAVNQVATGKVSATFDTQQAYFQGRGNYFNLSMLRPETPSNTYNYAVGPETLQKPIKGALYTQFHVIETVPVPQVTLTTKTRIIETYLWVNESLTAYINALVGYFNATATVKEDLPATTAAAALGNEVPAATLSAN